MVFQATWRLLRGSAAPRARSRTMSVSHMSSWRHRLEPQDCFICLEPGGPAADRHTAVLPFALPLRASRSSCVTTISARESSSRASMAAVYSSSTVVWLTARPEGAGCCGGLVEGPCGRERKTFGILSFCTRGARAPSRISRRTPRCGVVPASISTCTPTTKSAMRFDTTKKSMTLVPHDGNVDAKTVPPFIWGQFDRISSSGEFCQSAIAIHGPSTASRSCVAASRILRLVGLVSFSPETRYSVSTWMPPLTTPGNHAIRKRAAMSGEAGLILLFPKP